MIALTQWDQKSGRQLCENWAVGPIITMAARRQIEQRVAHRLERVGLSTKVGRARFRQRLDLRTGAIAIGPKPKQLSDFFDRKAEIAGIGDETQSMHVRLRIVPIAAIAPWWRWDKSDLLIVADHTLRDATRR